MFNQQRFEKLQRRKLDKVQQLASLLEEETGGSCAHLKLPAKSSEVCAAFDKVFERAKNSATHFHGPSGRFAAVQPSLVAQHRIFVHQGQV